MLESTYRSYRMRLLYPAFDKAKAINLYITDPLKIADIWKGFVLLIEFMVSKILYPLQAACKDTNFFFLSNVFELLDVMILKAFIDY